MPIVSGDIDFFLSGGAGNSDPNASLGGVISTTELTAAAVENLFDNVSGQEANDGDTEYRLLYVKNNHGTLTLQGAVVWISGETPSADTLIDIALAGEGVNVTAETVANEQTAPVGETFTHPTTKGGGLVIGDIPPGEFMGIWIKRVISATAAAANADAAVLRVEGDTAA